MANTEAIYDPINTSLLTKCILCPLNSSLISNKCTCKAPFVINTINTSGYFCECPKYFNLN